MRGIHHLWESVLILLFGAAGACTVQVEDAAPEADRDDIATISQDIIGGVDVLNLNYTGVVALQFFDAPDGVCSGTLIKNDRVTTAAHCVESRTTAPTSVLVRMGNQAAIASNIVVHPEEDIAVVHLLTPLAMRVNGVVRTTGYLRRFDARSFAELDGAPMACFGYGANGPGHSGQGPSSLRLGIFGADFPGSTISRVMALRRDYGFGIGQGDSGAPCLDSLDMANGRLIASVFTTDAAISMTNPEIYFWLALATQ